MNIRKVRLDLEGVLVQLTDRQPPPYAKQLPLDVAWHIDNPTDLEYLLGQLVQTVHQDFDENALYIQYNASIKPSDLLRLRQLVQVKRPLALWRLVNLALDLGKTLKEFHTANLPQMLIHPERVGQQGDKFVLLPTLAGILPPLSRLPANDIACWLYYIAPEVLRTRGNDFTLLYGGDIYSLGRMLEVLAVSDYEPTTSDDRHTLAEKLVEAFEVNSPGQWPAGFERLQNLVTKMCSFLPEERPQLDEFLLELRAILGQVEPESHIQQLIGQNRLIDAEDCLKALDTTQQQDVFEFPKAKIHRLWAELELTRLPPNYVKAIDQLVKALKLEPRNPAINLKLAQTYVQHTTGFQHLLFASKSYAMAAELSGWREDIVTAWLDVLQQIDKPEEILDQIRDLPWDRCTPLAFLLRARSYLALEKYGPTWEETTRYFEKFGFNQEIYDLAKTAADHIHPLFLLRWMHQQQNKSRLEGPKAIVWYRNGQLEKAKEFLTLALLTQRPEEGS